VQRYSSLERGNSRWRRRRGECCDGSPPTFLLKKKSVLLFPSVYQHFCDYFLCTIQRHLLFSFYSQVLKKYKKPRLNFLIIGEACITLCQNVAFKLSSETRHKENWNALIVFILVGTSYGIRMGAHGHHPDQHARRRTCTAAGRARAAAMVTSLIPMFQPRSPRTHDSPSDSDPRVRYIHPLTATDYRCAVAPNPLSPHASRHVMLCISSIPFQ
jgi:hypothetical protein